MILKRINIKVIIILLSIFIVLFSLNLFERGYQQFSLLAESFIRGELSVREDGVAGDLDMVLKDGSYYWPLGPFPSVILIPFVLIFSKLNLFFYQGYIHPFITAVIFYLCIKLAIKFKYRVTDSLFLAFAFCFSSIYFFIALVSRSWYLSQAICVLFSLLAFYEFYTNKRWWLIGLYTSSVFATRFTAGCILLFFIAYVLFAGKLNKRKKIAALAHLLAPVLLVGFLLLLYNKLRFDSWFDNGYLTSMVQPEAQAILKQKYGLFSLKNIITNIYWYFLALPFPVTEPKTYHLVFPYVSVSPIGLSFFITSPTFLAIFRNTWKTVEQKSLWISILLTLFILLTYYASGFYQFGPRYMLDLLPTAFILLMYSFTKRKLTIKIRLGIVTSFIINTVIIFYYMQLLKIII